MTASNDRSSVEGSPDAAAERIGAPTSRLGVLLVEADTLAVYALSPVLANLGCEVTGVARSAEAAYRSAAARRPDLVLMGIGLEGPADGIDAARELKARHGVPILFVTAAQDGTTLARAAALGPIGYLIKPFLPRALEATLAEVCRAIRAR